MRKSSPYTAAWLVASGLLLGCATTSSSNNAGVPGASGPELIPPGSTSGTGSGWTSLSNNPISRGVRTASGAVVAAVTPKPKVENALDPTSLDYKSPAPKPPLYVSMGQIQEKAGRTDEAMKLYQKALEVDPNHLPALLAIAHLHDREGRLSEAEKVYRQATQKHPSQANVHNDLGLCLARQGKLSESVASLQKATDLKPRQVLYRNNIAKVLCELERNDEALTHLRAVHPQGSAHYNMGYLLYEAGRDKLAADQMALALRADPQLAPAQELLAQLDPNRARATTPRAAQAVAERPVVQTGHRTGEESQRGLPTVSTPATPSLRYPGASGAGGSSEEYIAPLPLPPVEAR